MQDRPVVVNGSNNTGMFAILAIVVIAAIALFVWQPWNTTAGPTHTTTIINQQPAGAGAAGGSGTTGGSGTSGSSDTSGGSGSSK